MNRAIVVCSVFDQAPSSILGAIIYESDCTVGVNQSLSHKLTHEFCEEIDRGRKYLFLVKAGNYNREIHL